MVTSKSKTKLMVSVESQVVEPGVVEVLIVDPVEIIELMYVTYSETLVKITGWPSL